MSLYLGDNLISGTQVVTDKSERIGQIIQSTIPLSDAGLHLLDGALISGSGAYADFVDYIASIYDASASYFCSESDWQTAVTNYGSCPCYVYNSTNNTVRLPKYTSEHGKLIKSNSSGSDWYRIYEDGWCEQGGNLPTTSRSWVNAQITLHQPFASTNYIVVTLIGAPYSTSNSDKSVISDKTTTTFNVDNYNENGLGNWFACGYTSITDYQYSPIYEYVVLATSTKTDIEVDIDDIATDLNGKADVDLSNASPVHSFATALNNATIRTVVETYHNGSSWYRVWSDGFIEQGGQTGSIASSSNSYQIVLNKTMGNTDYNIFMLGCWTNATTSGSNASYQGVSRYIGNPVAKTTSSFTCQVASTGGSYSWFVCGY